MKKSILCGSVLFGLLWPQWAGADTAVAVDGVDTYTIPFNQSLIAKGYTVASPSNDFRLGIFPKVLSAPSEFVLKKRTIVDHPLPADQMPLSDYWEFDVVNKAAYDGQQPIVVQLQYQPNVNLKTVVFWNGTAWQTLPSMVIDPVNRIIRVYFHLPYARFLVLGSATVMSEGTASWYRYQGCDCAASPDYPKGTLLRVTNSLDQRSVVVRVNDYGPDRAVHPERVIDLDVTAFKKIAVKSEGVAPVIVEPVK